MDIVIRKALCSEAKIVTEITFEAKMHWNYPEQWLAMWKEELTITPEYIRDNTVYVAEDNGQILGYYSIVTENGIYSLDNIFIKPKYIRCGVGTTLFNHLNDTLKRGGISFLQIVSDPHAKGFYEKMGAKYIGEKASSIEGRTMSIYKYFTV